MKPRVGRATTLCCQQCCMHPHAHGRHNCIPAATHAAGPCLLECLPCQRVPAPRLPLLPQLAHANDAPGCGFQRPVWRQWVIRGQAVFLLGKVCTCRPRTLAQGTGRGSYPTSYVLSSNRRVRATTSALAFASSSFSSASCPFLPGAFFLGGMPGFLLCGLDEPLQDSPDDRWFRVFCFGY